jgi:hypothetical protein
MTQHNTQHNTQDRARQETRLTIAFDFRCVPGGLFSGTVDDLFGNLNPPTLTLTLTLTLALTLTLRRRGSDCRHLLFLHRLQKESDQGLN